MEVIRTYTLNNIILETIILSYEDLLLHIKINSKVLDYESLQYHYIDVQYNNISIPYMIDINEFLDLLHKPFPSGNQNEIYNKVVYDIVINSVEYIPISESDDTQLFMNHYLKKNGVSTDD
jgi:hypothetical protein